MALYDETFWLTSKQFFHSSLAFSNTHLSIAIQMTSGEQVSAHFRREALSPVAIRFKSTMRRKKWLGRVELGAIAITRMMIMVCDGALHGLVMQTEYLRDSEGERSCICLKPAGKLDLSMHNVASL
jgi:hypothetical protein